MKESLQKGKLHIHLCGYGYEDATHVISKMHIHPFWQMNLVSEGYAYYRTAHGRRKILPGDVILTPPGAHHCLETVEGCGFCDYSFKFYPGTDFTVSQTVFSAPEMREQQLIWINALGDIFKSAAPPELIRHPVEFPLSADLPGTELLEGLLYGFCRRLCSEETTDDSWLLKKLRLMVQSRKGRPVSVRECAHKLNCSAGHLRLMVRKETGISTKEFIDRERIKTAKQLLTWSNISITHLAEKMGFSDLIYFDRFFKKYSGETPGAFRKRSQFSQIPSTEEKN